MKKVRWGVIGAGGIADRRTLPGMMQAKNAELVSVMEIDAGFSEQLRVKYGAKRAYTTAQQLVEDPEIDAVYIASPVFAHAQQAMAAAGFRADDIARRKLETITAALNDGWKPDWNDTGQYKYVPCFWIKQRPGQTSAGLANANAHYAPSRTTAHFGSRLCFKNAAVARYAANQFTELYALILVENY